MGLLNQRAKETDVVKVSNYLSEKNIFIFPSGPSKQQVFGKLIGALDLNDPNEAIKAIKAREEAGSTVIAPGLSLPHARLHGLKQLVAALGICPGGVMDPSIKGKPVHIFVLFLGPAENMREHLAFLAAVSVLFQKSGIQEKLLKCKSAPEALALLRTTEEKN